MREKIQFCQRCEDELPMYFVRGVAVCEECFDIMEQEYWENHDLLEGEQNG